jgi:hypothetical protein
MKELLLEYLIGSNQVEQFKTWLIEQGIDTEGGAEAWVDSEIGNL